MGGLRFGSGAWRLRLYLFVFFCIIGLVLVMLGFNLDKVDAWLDRQGGWLDALGKMVFDIVLFLIGVVAALYASSLFFPKKWGPKAGIFGAMFAGLIAMWMLYVLWQGGV